MNRQSLPARLFHLLAILCLSWTTSCSDDSAPEGLSFEQPVIDLGELWAGEVVPLEFPFRVSGTEVRIDTALPDCGCLQPRLTVNGALVPLGTVLAPGTKGILAVDYHTAGFQGRKFTGVDLAGSGLGLPLKLEVQSWLRPWFEVTPRFADFGQVQGDTEQLVQMTVVGQEPFKITALLGAAPPIHVRGLPSLESKKQHTFQVVLPPTTAEGQHFGVLNLGTDQEGFAFTVPVSYRVAGLLWTIPDEKILLGELSQRVEFFTQVEVGVRAGRLELPQVVTKGLPDAVVRIETVVEGSRYRVQLGLTPGAEHISGELILSLPYTDQAGTSEVLERHMRVFGVVKKTKVDENPPPD